jgi:hypothetical protein
MVNMEGLSVVEEVLEAMGDSTVMEEILEEVVI